MGLETGVEYGITDYIADGDAYDNLTDEQLKILADGGTVKFGETEAAPAEEESSEPPVAAAAEKPVESEVEVKPDILTKDGKHTIPFKELEDAREQAAQWKQIADAQTSLAESLKAAKVEDKGTGDTKAQDEVLEKYQKEYPELADVLTPAIQKMIDARVNATVAELEKKFADAIAPIQQSAVDNSVEAHFSAIYDAVPDFDKIVESGAVQKWVETLPSYVKAAAQTVLEKGTATQIIELFSDYKASLPPAKADEPGQTKTEIAAKAAAAIAKAKSKAPASLSDFPAGTVKPDADSLEAETKLSPMEQFARLQGKSDKEILAWANRTI